MRIKRGNIHYVNFSSNRGSSIQRGVRPALILQCDAGNKHSTTTTVIPISSKQKGLPMHVRIDKSDCKMGELECTSYVFCEQIRVVNQDDVHSKICVVHKNVLERIHTALMIHLGFKKNKEKKEKLATV
ncbi:type II toxin-antitoxin system PemK/MazF family toxin [Aquisalibacillus elongatus]|uniref:mRNA interferase n=1 Tax=Aquisalibacillus elongatus TaxID=485577 RepID=A0A3N5CBZ9_9BACI|nr:type II toxin-antitoxin system PemK/MazF family toxin [Aquisalibacillus elongatus]RPF54421.1 mRNA interferase MazF [Aquisalibacillus elongatus]